jgi:O-methyltransferase
VKRIEQAIASAAQRMGVSISRTSSAANRLPIEATDADRDIIAQVRPFTMTSAERIWALAQAVDHVEALGIPGAFVECGVWRGGSIMAMALRLQQRGTPDREFWLYDTFEGMTPPSEFDVEAGSGAAASEMMASTPVGDGDNVWAYASEQDVRVNVASTGYPIEQFHFIKGDVAQTLLTDIPDEIALLRLDTDWYESTRAGLEHLYPRLTIGGVCILDDYGHWQGARKAVDEYFAALGMRPFMHPIDYSGRVFLKMR